MKNNPLANRIHHVAMLVGVAASLSLVSCTKEDPPTGINAPGLQVLDEIGRASDGWGIGGLVVAEEENGAAIYYTVSNLQTEKYELRRINAAGVIETLTSGSWWTNGLALSADGEALLMALNRGNGTAKTTRLMAFHPATGGTTVFFTEEGDGEVSKFRYLNDGRILYTQGDAFVRLSIKLLDPVNKQITTIFGKEHNAWVEDVDEDNGRILVYGWDTSTTMTIDFNGSLIKTYSETSQIDPVSFSPDYQHILAGQLSNTDVNSYNSAVYFDIVTGAKSALTDATVDAMPLGYTPDGRLMYRSLIQQDKWGVYYFNLANGETEAISNEGGYAEVLGFYLNSPDRPLLERVDENFKRYLYILNR